MIVDLVDLQAFSLCAFLFLSETSWMLLWEHAPICCDAKQQLCITSVDVGKGF